MKTLKFLVVAMVLVCMPLDDTNVKASLTPSADSDVDCFDVPHSLCYGILVTPDGNYLTQEYGSNYKIVN